MGNFTPLCNCTQYAIIDKAILAQQEAIPEHDYRLYRPLSKNLATHGYYLSACLLRRKLVYNILKKGQSKYYKYAISDFNLAEKYAKEVIGWQNFHNHELFISDLKEKHSKKVSFWSAIK